MLPIPATMNILLTFISITVTAFFFFHSISKNSSKKKRTPPEPAGAWPIIGHLPLLLGTEVPYKILWALADKYGPIFTFRMGSSRVLVVSDMKLAKECFTTNDMAFANRPKSIATEIMCYNYSVFVLSNYSPYWAYVRKIVSRELLSVKQVEVLSHIRVSEVNTSMREMYEFWVKNRKGKDDMVRMDLKNCVTTLILNMVVRVLAGKRVSGDEGKRARDAIRIFLELFSAVVLADVIPFLRIFDLGGKEKAMKETAKELDDILGGWLAEHKTKRNLCEVKRQEDKDFMDVMLSILDSASSKELGGFDVDTVIKSTLLGLLLGSAETSIVTLIWALSLLLNNPHILKKSQDELDLHVGRGRQVNGLDLKKLVYLQGIIKETLRLYPPTPLSVPHESREDCVVGGYNIPKGTRLLTNFPKIQRDPIAWEDPNKFRPERFLTTNKDVDVGGQNFELIPFGSGRRICPGISLAMEIQSLILARFIQGFELRTLPNEAIDMTECGGITNFKATPLEVLLTPRLSPDLY